MKIFNRATNYEISGLRLELMGLCVLLIAAVWQTSISDWFDRQDLEFAYWIQEDVNAAVLDNQREIAFMATKENIADLHKISSDVSQRSGDAILRAIDQGKRRVAMQKEQAANFKNIRFYLAIIGAILIIFGKYRVFLHKAGVTK